MGRGTALTCKHGQPLRSCGAVGQGAKAQDASSMVTGFLGARHDARHDPDPDLVEQSGPIWSICGRCWKILDYGILWAIFGLHSGRFWTCVAATSWNLNQLGVPEGLHLLGTISRSQPRVLQRKPCGLMAKTSHLTVNQGICALTTKKI